MCLRSCNWLLNGFVDCHLSVTLSTIAQNIWPISISCRQFTTTTTHFSTHQNNIRNVFATSKARHTCSENPSASCVSLICRYCGTYGMMPPTTIAVAAVQLTTWPTVRPSSSFKIQSMMTASVAVMLSRCVDNGDNNDVADGWCCARRGITLNPNVFRALCGAWRLANYVPREALETWTHECEVERVERNVNILYGTENRVHFHFSATFSGSNTICYLYVVCNKHIAYWRLTAACLTHSHKPTKKTHSNHNKQHMRLQRSSVIIAHTSRRGFYGRRFKKSYMYINDATTCFFCQRKLVQMT